MKNIKQSVATLLFILSGNGAALLAQQLIPVNTKTNAVVFEVNNNKEVNTIYLGQKLANESDYKNVAGQYRQGTDYTGIYNSAYTPSGSKNLLEPAIAVRHADGNLSLSLQYVSHKTTTISAGVSQTEIVLKDPVYPVEVHLFIKSFFDTDVIEQWATIQHQEKGSITLNKYASANLYLKGNNDFYLYQHQGDWAREMNPEETRLTHGIKVLDSKLGTRTNLFQPTVFMVSLEKPSTEDEGKVLMGGIEWAGNFRNEFEVDALNNLRIISGINNAAAAYTLKKGEVFTTPKFWYTLSQTGKGTASRNVHNWARDHKILDGRGDRMTLLNNWEATYFDFDEAKLKTLIADTKKLGVDMFLLDDGWFGNTHPRNGDNAALGDWDANKKKLPNGVASLVQTAKDNDVKFGIWLEPEMVNPKSDLYKNHPDWVLKEDKRPEYYFRNQLVLDLANPKVQDFVFGVVDGLFTKNPELAYIKWDCNAVIYNAHSAYLKENQGNLYTDYVKGLYKVLERIRAKYPKVPIMLCSGGSGRVDYGTLEYFTEFWASDNTDPFERIFIQWEYSHYYPALAVANHVTDWGKQPLKYRTDVAMMGRMGFDIVVSHLNEDDLTFAQEAIKNYDALRNTIWQGNQYRLQSPYGNDAMSVSYVNNQKTEGVVFTYLVSNRYEAGTHNPLKLKGLDANANYKVEEINVYPGKQATVETATYSGDFLMKVGVNPKVSAHHTSVVLKLTKA
ncbi:alpha-galactosidase [Flavobacterium akiainvivens]|uniref:Alpha-galactosidase n=1 Tax=Flavobacterium akiainvivens TaxID=1202724 RepID=A0A0M9VHQ7_9FLAO|nr:alpha-galactosidase [Flavobacterium akiainvivens]KOS05840.1 alpha-galactosidase [Flavobacterium akiainvivens]SFQ56910.1 alpha-galactosidase [Flavobacterium akiainvivens]